MSALRLLGVGWFVAASIGVGLVAGLWLDGRLSTSPLFTLAGLFVGIAAAFVGLFRMLYEVVEEGDKEKR